MKFKMLLQNSQLLQTTLIEQSQPHLKPPLKNPGYAPVKLTTQDSSSLFICMAFSPLLSILMAILAGTNISQSMTNGHWHTWVHPFGIGQQRHSCCDVAQLQPGTYIFSSEFHVYFPSVCTTRLSILVKILSKPYQPSKAAFIIYIAAFQAMQHLMLVYPHKYLTSSKWLLNQLLS